MIKLILHAPQANSSQVLTVELTDPEQVPYFLYTLDCSETEFQQLKADQGFIFAFQLFPLFITDLLKASSDKHVMCSL